MLLFFKQYIPYYKNYIKKFIYVFIALIMVAIGTSGTAYIMKPLLDDIFINKDENMLIFLPIIVIFLYLLKGIGNYIQIYYISFIGQDIVKTIRNKLFKNILELDMEFFNKKQTGDLISRITNDINRIQITVSSHIASFIQESLTIIALTLLIIYQSPELAFFGLIILPISIFPLSKLAKKMKVLSFKSQEKNSDITSHLSETFNNIEIIKASASNSLESERFKKHNQDFFNINIKSVKTNALVSPIMEILGSLAIASVIVIGGKLVIEGEITPGSFFSFLTALFMIYTPIKRLSSIYNQMQDAIAANERINHYLNLKPQIISGNSIFPENINNISFEDLSLNYKDTNALKNINISINKGETLALIGESGGGKTSFINTLIRFFDPSSGKILINGINLKDFKTESLRNNISLVTQKNYIFNNTVASNVSYGQEFDENKVISALKLADAYDFVSKLPNGIFTILEEAGSNISGGQQQRISIARALYKNPQILILDEATSSLDNKSEDSINKALLNIKNDKIVIIIAHRLSTIKNADNIAFFNGGEIICYGTHSYIKNNCEAFKLLNSLS
ncbi:ABC transporter ATP-binding protein [bacterium]|nr:ABC transporter ATP-binding protein [bacterium]